MSGQITKHPLRRFDLILARVTSPFSTAQNVERYATHGYRLFGIVLAVMLFTFWLVGGASWTGGRLPTSVHDTLQFVLGLVGLNDIPETLPGVVLIAVLYGVGYRIKSVRLAVGEKFTSLFFGLAHGGILTGEWCLAHRWTSLFIVIGLAAIITLGSSFIVGQVRSDEKLEDEFRHWLDSVDNFFGRATFSSDESNNYRPVRVLWNDKYRDVLKTADPQRTHPALKLHLMLDKLYASPPNDRKEWHKLYKRTLPELERLMGETQPPAPPMTASESRSWALMNILIGRVYVRLADECGDCREVAAAKKYFSAIDEKYSRARGTAYNLETYYAPYRDAAHNGLGMAYAAALPSMLKNPSAPPEALRSVCGTPAECASLALEQYEAVASDSCSFEGRRRVNNTIDLLARIGLYYDRMPPAAVDLTKVCGGHVTTRSGLADCIETQLGGMLKCAGTDPPTPLIFVTAAQAYGVSAELRRGENPAADVEREVKAAGHYLRLAYALNHDAATNMRNWGLCYFRFALRDQKLGGLFWDSIPFGLDRLPTPDAGYLKGLIEEDVKRCR